MSICAHTYGKAWAYSSHFLVIPALIFKLLNWYTQGYTDCHSVCGYTSEVDWEKLLHYSGIKPVDSLDDSTWLSASPWSDRNMYIFLSYSDNKSLKRDPVIAFFLKHVLSFVLFFSGWSLSNNWVPRFDYKLPEHCSNTKHHRISAFVWKNGEYGKVFGLDCSVPDHYYFVMVTWCWFIMFWCSNLFISFLY